MERFVTIWFPQLKTDWFSIQQPNLRGVPFILSTPDQGRMLISAVNDLAKSQGIETGMPVADARALVPGLQVLDDQPGLEEKLLSRIAKYCIRYTNIAAISPPDTIILNATGCAHLWGGEMKYLHDISQHLGKRGYRVRATMADTVGTAWAIAHYGGTEPIIEYGKQMEAILSFPPSALRIEFDIADRLHKLGLHQIRNFILMPRNALRRRFGEAFLLKLDQALGNKKEPIIPVQPVEPWRERLPCLEPIVTATGIEIALQRLLDTLSKRLHTEGMGIRKLIFFCIRVDGKIERKEIGTHSATHNAKHLFKLFEDKISTIEPALGIELFMLEAIQVEKCISKQEKLWDETCGPDDPGLSELLDRLSNRFENLQLQRFLPAEHWLPEKSFKEAKSLVEMPDSQWVTGRSRPLHLLPVPQPIEVTAPIPDYPPMHFRYNGKLHIIKKADGPERIEQEWWISEGPLRDYYTIEDNEGQRYWIFRSGHYSDNKMPKWFIHGFYA